MKKILNISILFLLTSMLVATTLNLKAEEMGGEACDGTGKMEPFAWLFNNDPDASGQCCRCRNESEPDGNNGWKEYWHCVKAPAGGEGNRWCKNPTQTKPDGYCGNMSGNCQGNTPY